MGAQETIKLCIYVLIGLALLIGAVLYFGIKKVNKNEQILKDKEELKMLLITRISMIKEHADVLVDDMPHDKVLQSLKELK